MSDALTIKTNRVPRPLVYRYDVPESVLADQFEHLSEDDAPDGFVCYRGRWYHTSDFLSLRDHPADSALRGWHGYTSDSAFSGVVIRLSADGESCILGTYFA